MEEENPSSEQPPSVIVECPHCHTRVIPKSNNLCPACQEDISDLQDTDPNQVAFTIHESEELPSYCVSCNMYTERIVRASADDESGILTAIFGLSAPDNTSNVILYLPQCEMCDELEGPQLVEVDYEHQTMTLVVHRGFRDRVIQLRENPS